jgi:uncharacterized protein YcbX
LPYLSGISIYPVKSLEPVSVPKCKVLRSGALEGDRAFAIFDAEDRFVNGKRNALVHRLRSSFDPLTKTLRLARADTDCFAAFHVDHQRDLLQAWLSEFFSIPVTFKQNTEVGFPDDLDCPGPTIIGSATLVEVASWFPPLDACQMRIRFRANLEIAAPEPFWEEHLYAAKGSLIRFRIGDVMMNGNNPCQRCVVPPRDPFTGENNPQFAKIFAQRREQTLPPWAERSRFNHFYRLAINTIVPPTEAGKILRIGDEIEILDGLK